MLADEVGYFGDPRVGNIMAFDTPGFREYLCHMEYHMQMAPKAELTYNGKRVDTSPEAFGELRDSRDLLHDPTTLRLRVQEDGYLFLPGLLNRHEVLDAREEILRRLGGAGFLDPAFPVTEGIPAPMSKSLFLPQFAKENAPLERVIFNGPMMVFYERLLGGRVRHFDFVWLRAKRPGIEDATPPHYDVVFMGRGTKRLFTSWIPLEDVPMEKGGLMILEGSHRLEEVKSTYGQLDVDTYCENKPEARSIVTGEKMFEDRTNAGTYPIDALTLPEKFGGRWLTADFRAGDVLLFGMYTMHISTDNHSRGFRLSTDTRYQLASEPVDERWIGENPIAHGPAGKRGFIC